MIRFYIKVTYYVTFRAHYDIGDCYRLHEPWIYLFRIEI